MYLLYGMRYLVRIHIIIYVHMRSHTLKNVCSLVTNVSNDYGRPISSINNLHQFGGIYCLLPAFYTITYVWFANPIISSLLSRRDIFLHVNHIFLANINHLWPSIIFHQSWVQKKHNLKSYLLLSKPSNLGNPTSNKILEWINAVLGNLVYTYNIKASFIYEDARGRVS